MSYCRPSGLLHFLASFWLVLASGSEVKAQSGADLCTISKSGGRNGQWHMCYQALQPRVGPDETILCDPGILRVEGHCRIVPLEVCTLVEGAIRTSDLPCWVTEDIADPDRGVIGWRPIRSLTAQAPVLAIADFISTAASAGGKDKVVEFMRAMGEAFEGTDWRAGRMPPQETDAAYCALGADLVARAGAAGETLLSTGLVTRLNAERDDAPQLFCDAALICVASSHMSDPPVIEGLLEAFQVINQLGCRDMVGMNFGQDHPIEKAVANARYGAASVAALRLVLDGAALSDSEIMAARAAIHAYLVPETAAGPALFDQRLAAALEAAEDIRGVDGLTLEYFALDLLARRRGTTLHDAAALLFPQ